MDILHTPWRREYVVSAREYEGCLFCNILADERTDEQRRILLRGDHTFLILNTYPYTPGHVMAVPYRHLARTTELEPTEFAELLRFAQLGERLLRRCYGCRSVHGGANLGIEAGAGVPGHLHLHMIAWPEAPLYDACQGADGPPETIEETYRLLHHALGEPGVRA